jgi:hypothetical protein
MAILGEFEKFFTPWYSSPSTKYGNRDGFMVIIGLASFAASG